MSFPKNFIWGVASASYQIEGGAFEDGKGASIWDTFSHTPGKVFNDQTGDISCDAYHHFEEDLDIMKDLGIKNYRFSISWPRIYPNGFGELNTAGLAYYDKIVDGCLARNIEPWITLFHWDYPQVLQDKGGWENRDNLKHFAKYAETIATHFKGRVTNFMTINEPQCFIGLGYSIGVHAPGLHISSERLFLTWHHALMAHGIACKEIRKIIPGAKIGLASTGNLCYVKSHDSVYSEALSLASFFTSPAQLEDAWIFNHQWFLDPVCNGAYPDDPLHPWQRYKQSVSPFDLEIIHQPIDFIGLNVYNGHEMAIDAPENSSDILLKATKKFPGYPRTSLKWPITPEVMYWGPKLLAERYGLPVIISENGQSCHDRIFIDGKVHDPDRIDFLHRYLLELKAAAEDQVPVIGFLHWSYTDNMEWHSGYEDRFGIVYVDYRNQNRIPKDSAYWYKEVIKTNGDCL